MPSPMQTDATLLDVTCCLCLHTLLHVPACSWELLHAFVHHCQHGTNNVRSWSGTDCQSDVALGYVVASVCTYHQTDFFLVGV